MNVLIILIPLALLLGGGALVGFLAAVRNGQFDDLDTPGKRALFDDSERKQNDPRKL